MKRKNVLAIIFIAVVVLLAAACVVCGIYCHNAHLYEMNAQIALNGVYDNRLTLYPANYYKEVWFGIGAGIAGIAAFISGYFGIGLLLPVKEEVKEKK